jgi:hypothetical protein
MRERSGRFACALLDATGIADSAGAIVRLALIAFFVCASPSLWAADRAVTGQWEYTMTTDGQSHVVTSCLTAQDALQFNGDTASGKDAAAKKNAGRCSIESYNVTGASVAYTLVCGARTIRSSTVFHGDTSQGTLTTTADGKTVSTDVKAHRIGACP